MKSRALCYDPATARMQVKRFFPVLILYAGGIGLLAAMMIFSNGSSDVTITCGIRDFIQFTGAINLIYGIVMAQLLFGDLYSSRLCYAIHALPTTRGGYFGTQIILGLLGSLLPNLALLLGMLLFLGEYQYLGLYWFYASQVQFLCFYGISVLSALCAGNRFGMLVVNGIILLFSSFLYWFIVHVYNPLLYGLPVDSKWFTRFSPIEELVLNLYFYVHTKSIETNGTWNQIIEEIKFTDIIKLLPFYAVAGVVAMYLAMRIYRKRQLECCGDLLAFRRGKPVFLVLFSLGIACVLHIIAASEFPAFTYVFLGIGLVLGWFGGLMLLERQVNVFQWKHFVQLGLLAAACLLTMFITALDPLAKVHKLPDASKIQSARISRYVEDFPVYSPAEEILEIHQTILDAYDQEQEPLPWLVQLFRSKENPRGAVQDKDGMYHESSLMHIMYTMEDGSTFHRQYQISDLDEAFLPVKAIMSRPERIFANKDGKTAEDYRAETTFITLECSHYVEMDLQTAIEAKTTIRTQHPIQYIRDDSQINDLWDAYLKDCELGVTTNDWFFQRGATDNLWIYTTESQINPRFYLPISNECVNTLNWLIDHGYHDPIQDTP